MFRSIKSNELRSLSAIYSTVFCLAFILRMDELPNDLLDFVLENDFDSTNLEEDAEKEWRFDNVDMEAVELLKKRNYSANTAKKILYVLKLWGDWVTEKICD